MNITTHQDQIELSLQPQELVMLQQMSGDAIECKAGIVWVTVSGDGFDHILEAGDTYTPEKNGRVVIQAMEAAHVALLDENGKLRSQILASRN